MNRLVFLTITWLSALNLSAQNPQKGSYGYLFCHLSDHNGWTAFAISRDGSHYEDVLGGGDVIDGDSHARISGGTRDPYICRRADSKGYLMVTTDMSVGKTGGWDNYGIDMLQSEDMMRWRSVTIDFRRGAEAFSDPEAPDPYRDYSTITRVWAPQIFWDGAYQWADGTKGGYFIYYSMLNKPEESYDRVYYSYADRSFTRITKPRLLFDWGYAAIDPDINYIAADGLYHMLIKKGGQQPGIYAVTAKTLKGPWKEPDARDRVSFEGKKKCEGPSAFRLIGDTAWRVAYIEYSSRPHHYRICKADSRLSHFSDPTDIIGVRAPQHGSFMTLTRKEYRRLKRWKGIKR